MKTRNKQKNDRREVFGWITYDWANSVFFTTVVGVLIGQYITTLAQGAVGENGVCAGSRQLQFSHRQIIISLFGGTVRVFADFFSARDGAQLPIIRI